LDNDLKGKWKLTTLICSWRVKQSRQKGQELGSTFPLVGRGGVVGNNRSGESQEVWLMHFLELTQNAEIAIYGLSVCISFQKENEFYFHLFLAMHNNEVQNPCSSWETHQLPFKLIRYISKTVNCWRSQEIVLSQTVYVVHVSNVSKFIKKALLLTEIQKCVTVTIQN
jgi:hypothetical protein